MRLAPKGLRLGVLIAFVLNALVWTFNAELLADDASLHHAQTSLSDCVGDGPTSPEIDQGSHCNHGCHALQHLLGLSAGTPLSFSAAGDTWRSQPILGSFQHDPRAEERPPRVSFTA